MPLGVSNSLFVNFIFIVLILSVVLGGFKLFIHFYPNILHWCLEHKKAFLTLPVIIILLGLNIWIGFDKVFGFIPKITEKVGWNIRTTSVWSSLSHTFAGMEIGRASCRERL